jgi:hypothetical protein
MMFRLFAHPDCLLQRPCHPHLKDANLGKRIAFQCSVNFADVVSRDSCNP